MALACALAAPATRAGDHKDHRHSHRNDPCQDHGGDDRHEKHCDVRELTLPGSRLELDASPNGGIEVRGEKRGDIQIRATVVAQGRTEEEARALAAQVRIETSPVVRAIGPDTQGKRGASYWVSYRVAVPEDADLSLETMNGGIALYEIRGKADFKTVNGGVVVESASGSVQGRTTNGGVDISLRGSSWEGDGLDVETTNGGVKVTMPTGYNARLVTGTVNGGMRVDFPVTVQGKIDRRLDVEIGSGGPTVRAVTTNGGVVIRQR
jgi:hypothetical protein